MKSKSKLSDPGIILLGVFLFFAAVVLIWWPTNIYWLGISLAGWLMFFSYIIWFALAVTYVYWIEKNEKEEG